MRFEPGHPIVVDRDRIGKVVFKKSRSLWLRPTERGAVVRIETGSIILLATRCAVQFGAAET